MAGAKALGNEDVVNLKVRADTADAISAIANLAKHFSLARLSAYAFGATVVGGAFMAGKAITSMAASTERDIVRLTTAYQSEMKAMQEMGKAIRFAATTPFEVESVIKSMVDLTVFKFDPWSKVDLDKQGKVIAGSRSLMELMGDMAASRGVDARVAIHAFTRAAAGEWEVMRNNFTLTRQQIPALKGLVAGTDEYRKALIKALSEEKRFQGGMALQAKTIYGMGSNIKDAITNITMYAAGAVDASIKSISAYEAIRKSVQSLYQSVSGKGGTWDEKKRTWVQGMFGFDDPTDQIEKFQNTGRVIGQVFRIFWENTLDPFIKFLAATARQFADWGNSFFKMAEGVSGISRTSLDMAASGKMTAQSFMEQNKALFKYGTTAKEVDSLLKKFADNRWKSMDTATKEALYFGIVMEFYALAIGEIITQITKPLQGLWEVVKGVGSLIIDMVTTIGEAFAAGFSKNAEEASLQWGQLATSLLSLAAALKELGTSITEGGLLQNLGYLVGTITGTTFVYALQVVNYLLESIIRLVEFFSGKDKTLQIIDFFVMLAGALWIATKAVALWTFITNIDTAAKIAWVKSHAKFVLVTAAILAFALAIYLLYREWNNIHPLGKAIIVMFTSLGAGLVAYMSIMKAATVVTWLAGGPWAIIVALVVALTIAIGFLLYNWKDLKKEIESGTAPTWITVLITGLEVAWKLAKHLLTTIMDISTLGTWRIIERLIDKSNDQKPGQSLQDYYKSGTFSQAYTPEQSRSIYENTLKSFGMGSIPGKAVGSSYIPGDGINYLHKGEMVIPRNFSDALRAGDLVIGGKSSGGTNSTRNNNVNIVQNFYGKGGLSAAPQMQTLASDLAYNLQ